MNAGRDFSKVSPLVWHSQKFGRLRDHVSRYLYLYFLTSPHSNPAGCYDLDEAYALADTRLDPETYHRALSELQRVALVAVDNPVDNSAGSTISVLIENWCSFNAPANAGHAMAIIGALKAVSSHDLKAKRLQELKQIIKTNRLTQDSRLGLKLSRLLDTVSDTVPTPLLDPLDTVSRHKDSDIDSDRDRETQTETETEESQDTARAHVRAHARETQPSSLAAAPPNGAAREPEKNKKAEPDPKADDPDWIDPRLETGFLRKTKGHNS